MIIFLVLYYQPRQQELVRQYQTKEILQVSTSVALGISEALNEDNFKKLEDIMGFAETTSNFDFIHTTLCDPEALDTISIVRPKNFDLSILDSIQFDIQTAQLKTQGFTGQVTVGVGRARIEEKIAKLNSPIYSLLVTLIIAISIILYFLIRRITQPLQELTVFASSLKYESNTHKSKFTRLVAKEINTLRDSLIDLSKDLSNQKAINDSFMTSLEEKVKSRTSELQITTSQLEKAQKIAKISTFRLCLQLDFFDVHSNFFQVTDIAYSENFSFEDFLIFVDIADKNRILDFLSPKSTLEKREEIEFCLINSDKSKKYLYCAGEFNKDIASNQVFFNGIIQDLSEIKERQKEIEQLSLVAKNTSNAVIITDLEKKILWVNESAERITGYKNSELIGKTPRIFQFEKTNQQKVKSINESLAKFEEIKQELLNKNKNGEEYWISINIVALRDDKNIPFGFMAIETDVTQTKHLQVQREQYVEMLEESRSQIRKMNAELEQKVIEKTKDIQRLALFPHQTPNPIIEIDLESETLLYQNPSSIKRFGDLRNDSYKHVKEVLGLQNIEANYSNAVDEIYFANYIFERNLYILENKILRIYLHDITDRQKNEKSLVLLVQQLKKTEQELTDKKVALENSLEKLQQTQQQIINKERLTVLGVLIAGIAHEINNPLGAIRASGENLIALLNDLFFKEIIQFTKDEIAQCAEFVGSLQVKSITSIEQRTFAKNLELQITETFPSLSNIKSLAKSLAQMGIESLNDDILAFLNQTKAEALLNLCLRMYNIKNSTIVIKKAAEQGSKVVNALNSFSHGTEGKPMASFNLNENLETVIIILWSKIRSGSQVVNNIPKNIEIFGYEDELTQVWTNIIINALQASDYSCSITVNYHEINQNHEIIISNDGPRIPENIIDKLFDPFFTTKNKGEGTGLGLNIVKQIIEKHEGTIHVNSSEDLTSFIIQIPTSSI